MASPGARGGWSTTLLTRSLLADVGEDPTLRGAKPTLRENLELGIGKAQRGIVYSHREYRNVEHQGHPLQHARVRSGQ
jgi:hypothetical protein